MGDSQFLMDTSGHCFFCLKKATTDKICGVGPDIPSDEDRNVPKIFSFQNISSYLKTNLKEVFSDSISLSSNSLQDLEQSEFKGTLCEVCGHILDLFSQRFLELEAIQMKLHSSLRSINDIIGDSDKDDGQLLREFKNEMLRRPYTSFQFGIVERLRKKTLEGCTALFKKSLPLQTLVPVEYPPSVSVLPVLAAVVKTELDNLKPGLPSSAGTISTSQEADGIIYTQPRPLPVPGPSSSSNFAKFLHKCNTCPKAFQTYRERLDHQRLCPKKRTRRILLEYPGTQKKRKRRKPTRSRNCIAVQYNSDPVTVRNETSGSTETFILPSDEVPVTDSASIDQYSSIIPQTRKRKCLICSKEFKCYYNFRIHYRSTHLQIRYKCRQCGKEFANESYYDVHHRSVHMGVRLKCDLCSKTFCQTSKLKEHRSVVHFGKRSRCLYCLKTFKWSSYMKQHRESCAVRRSQVQNQVL